ncbi:MAG TPA: hypothetical protein VET87_07785 [Rubrivivax sp.]|jgi:hypothetical protein|nr:hypothetical protein [Rubrivivax sp.]
MSAVVLKALWIYGLAAVVSILIAAVIKAIVVLLNMFEAKPAAATASRPAVAPAPVGPDIAADHIAAICAAAYAVIGAHRIVRIDDLRSGRGWSIEGRQSHHSSHAVPTRAAKH